MPFYISCDINSVAIEKLINKYPEFKLKRTGVKNNHAPFKKRFFDVIVNVGVIEHVEELDAYLHDICMIITC